MPLRFREAIDEREVPAAQVKRRSNRGDDDHRSVFSHEEERPAHPRIFRVKARDEFRLSFGQIKRRAVVLCDTAHEKDQQAERLIGCKPDGVRLLRGDDAGERERAREHQCADNRESHRDFVRDHLCRRAQRAHQSVLRV